MYLYFTATSQYDMNYMEVTNVMVHRHLETRVILCFVALLCSVNTEIYLASHNKIQEEFLFLYPFQSDSRPPESCSVGSTVSPWGKQPELQFDDTLVSWSQYLTNLMHKICFTISFISCLYVFRAPCAHHQEVKIALHSLWYHHTYRCGDTRGCVLFHASTCFEHHVFIIRRSKLHYTASGVITPVHETATYRCDDTRGCVMQFWPPDNEHMVFETCRGMK